jgi:long-chain fatty acid transport protein
MTNHIECRIERKSANPVVTSRCWRLLLASKLLVLLFWSASALGAGFSLTEFSIKTMGSANAGTTAGSDEAATLYWNPAGMTRLEGVELQAGAAFVDFSAQFNDKGSTQRLLNPAPPPSFATVPSRGGSDTTSGSFVVPNGYLTVPLGHGLTAGIGVHVPFGLETKYRSDWVGRYHAIKSSVKTVNINPSIAYRIDDRWSVGAGVSAQYVDVTLTRAIFTGPGSADGLVELEGDDWAAGFNLGVLFEPDDRTRFGLAYRSAINHDIDGERTLSGLGHLDGRVGGSVPLDLPPNLALGFRRRLDDRLTLMGDLVWTGWSSFDEIRVSFDNGDPDDVTVTDWRDNWRFSLGMEYDLPPAWTLRGGFMYDQTPIPGVDERTPSVPDSDRYWLAVGATWRPSDRVSLDFAYSHLFFDDAPLRRTIDLAPGLAPGMFTDTLVGEFDNSVDALGMELSYRF